jgi:hypothetical protein
MGASITATCSDPEAAINHREIRHLRVCGKVFLLVSKSLTSP